MTSNRWGKVITVVVVVVLVLLFANYCTDDVSDASDDGPSAQERTENALDNIREDDDEDAVMEALEDEGMNEDDAEDVAEAYMEARARGVSHDDILEAIEDAEDSDKRSIVNEIQDLGKKANAVPENSPTVSPSSAGSPPSGTTPAPGVTPQSGGTFTMGCGNKNVGAVQSLIGLSVVCLGTEYDAYTWRSVPLKVDANCPEGFICTLHLSEGDKIIVTETSGKYSIVAATFRRKSGYPSGDAVHNACELLAKEKAFGASQNPKFDVSPHGYTCEGTKMTKTDSPASAGATDLTKEASAELVAKIVGGSASNWSELPGSNGKGWKYKGAPVSLTAPQGTRIDHPGGSANPGQSATADEATLWILS